ncbi:MAG: AmmeMemoRadiSam system protein B [Nitrospirae bacterium GWD2_57_9]|nr:MAG: AmmeMemoRadiSam system protein B [Nitrospirae bacterium GWD2_57_9]
MLRQPAVAGHFYRGTAEGLKQQVEQFIIPTALKRKALGILSPHAGLMYSGSVAGALYSNVDLPDRIVLIGPNHTGLGAPVSVMTEGSWETPLGRVPIDAKLAGSLLSRSPHIHDDALAHLREHSLEVQLPFIQYFKKQFTIVPVQMLDTRYETCLALGQAVAGAIAESGEPVLIVASSDMSHYEQAAAAREKDFRAINHILNLDPEGLYSSIREYGITMCGYGPAVAMLAASKKLGAAKAELVKYANSGDVSGDYDQVVGYAGIVIS